MAGRGRDRGERRRAESRDQNFGLTKIFIIVVSKVAASFFVTFGCHQRRHTLCSRDRQEKDVF